MPDQVSLPGTLRKRIDRCRRFGQVTPNGIVYDYELAGPSGAAFQLFREPQHSNDDIAQAEAQLRAQHDVVFLSVTMVSAEELAASIPPDPVRSRPIPKVETLPFHTILANDIVEQRIFFQGRLWTASEGAIPTLGSADVGRRLIFDAAGKFLLETYAQLIARTAAFTEFPRGGDAVRLRSPWEWAGTLVKVGDYGFVDGSVNEEYLIDVQITFNSVPFVDDSFCSASGGPGSIATAVTELKPTEQRAGLRCWRWRDGLPRADNGGDYVRVCRVWDWYPTS